MKTSTKNTEKKTHPYTGWPDKNEIVKRSTLKVGLVE